MGLSWEEYDSSYFHKYQSIRDIIKDADSKFPARKNSLDYYNYVAEILRKRFYHGYSHYSLSDNPLAFLSGKVWDHLSAIVIPDDIMKHPMAACSQQAIVLIEIFKRNGITYRRIGLPHHYTSEGFIEGSWRYFDTNMEPNLKYDRVSLQTLLGSKMIDSAYVNTNLTPEAIRETFANPDYGKINSAAAPNATLFHKTCFILISKWFLFSAFLLLMVFNLWMGSFKKYFKR